MRLWFAFLALSIGGSRLTAQQASVRGIVFADANGNGARDAGERGLPNVVVSNQDAVVTTDSSGAFGIAPGASGIVFVSVPDGYRAVGTFWRTIAAGASHDFALRPVPPVSEFTFIHSSDTHLAPAVLERTRRFRTLVDSLGPAFAIITGDLVRDAMSQRDSVARSYFDLFAAEARQFKTPLWTVPGNHENFGIIQSRWNIPKTHPLYGRGMYRHYFGPDYYSFTWGGIHFVGLNSVSMDDSAYYGNVDSVQLAWLERDLAHVPRTMPVVTFNHIPLVSGWENLTGYVDYPPVSSVGRINGKLTFRHTVSNVMQVMDVMSGHPYPLALGGHIHAGERLVYETVGRKTRFEQTAAIVGGGQLGTLTFPSGFTVYTVRNGEIDAGRFIPLTMERASSPAPARGLVELAAQIREADYRGDLARLRALFAETEPYTRTPDVARVAHYWRGFALWRRALNAANENGSVGDIIRDFEDANMEFRRALAIDSTYVEAQIGLAAGLMNIAHFRRADAPASAELMTQAMQALATARKADPKNPRLVFVLAARIFWAPPAFGGDRQKAVALVEETLAHTTPMSEPSLEPTWGDAELHMQLAFFKMSLTSPDLAGAERSARTALALRPQWHYVRDILLPQIVSRAKAGN